MEDDDLQTMQQLTYINRFFIYRKQRFQPWYFYMLVCGLFNNSGYVLVGTSAQTIAHHFNMDNFMSAFNMSLNIFSIFTISFSAKYLIKIPHKTRMIFILLCGGLSFLIIGFSTFFDYKWAFYLALVGSTICGIMQGLGEAAMLGFNKSFPSEIVGFWSSGTGLAGPFGAFLYLGLTAIKLELIYILQIYIALIPCQFIYYYCFRQLEHQRLIKIQQRSSQALDENNKSSKVFDEKNNPLQGDNQSNQTQEEAIVKEDDSKTNKKLNWKNVKITLKVSGFLLINLMLVYYLEYTCIVGWADRAHRAKDKTDNFVNDNAFAILNFIYQIGVFVSRSSLQFIKIKHVEILTIIQVVNVIAWIFIAISQNISVWIQIPLMFWVGLMGGSSYVNVNYQILQNESIPFELKELSQSVGIIFNSFGIFAATMTVMLVDNFLLT